MKIVKTIINTIIAIIITVTVLLFLLINLATSTILSKNYVLAKLDGASYYTKIYDKTKSNFEKYIQQSGLEEDVFEGIVSKEKVEKDIKSVISNIYDGIEEKIDTQEIKDNLNQKIEQAVGKKVMQSQKKDIDTLVEDICKEYTTSISHYNVEKDINNYLTKIMKYIDIAKKAVLVAIAICIIILLVVNGRRIYKTVTYLGVSVMSTGIFCLVTNIFINTKVKVQTILILNEETSFVIRNILQELLDKIKSYGYIMAVVGLLLIIISNLIHNIFKYGKSTYEKE